MAKALIRSKCHKQFSDLVMPQDGQGIPVISLKRQTKIIFLVSGINSSNRSHITISIPDINRNRPRIKLFFFSSLFSK